MSWWSISMPSPPCTPNIALTLVTLADIICDTLLISIPIAFLSRSSLKKSQKYRLYSIFAAGVLTTIVSIVQDVLVLRTGGGWAPALAGTVMGWCPHYLQLRHYPGLTFFLISRRVQHSVQHSSFGPRCAAAFGLRVCSQTREL